jgi:hypothetical protein
MTRTITAEFHIVYKYEVDDIDPAFNEVDRMEIERLAKMMLYIDVFQSMEEQAILDLIEVTIGS